MGMLGVETAAVAAAVLGAVPPALWDSSLARTHVQARSQELAQEQAVFTAVVRVPPQVEVEVSQS